MKCYNYIIGLPTLKILWKRLDKKLTVNHAQQGFSAKPEVSKSQVSSQGKEEEYLYCPWQNTFPCSVSMKKRGVVTAQGVLLQAVVYVWTVKTRRDLVGWVVRKRDAPRWNVWLSKGMVKSSVIAVIVAFQTTFTPLDSQSAPPSSPITQPAQVYVQTCTGAASTSTGNTTSATVLKQSPNTRVTPLEAYLRVQGRRIQAPVVDGNCLFRSLSYQLTWTQDRHIDVRSLAVRVQNFYGVPVSTAVKTLTSNTPWQCDASHWQRPMFLLFWPRW